MQESIYIRAVLQGIPVLVKILPEEGRVVIGLVRCVIPDLYAGRQEKIGSEIAFKSQAVPGKQ
jgi:hypothetical protein